MNYGFPFLELLSTKLVLLGVVFQLLEAGIGNKQVRYMKGWLVMILKM